MKIPKIVHTVWLGGEITPKEKGLIEKNKNIVPEYEYKIWNNDNYKQLVEPDFEFFINMAIENKKYAFASDCLKLLALKKEGGWAIDADVEIFQPFDIFESLHWVSGFESWAYKDHVNINTVELDPSLKNLSPITATWGAIPDHKFTNFLLQFYKITEETQYKNITNMPNTRWIRWIFGDAGVKADNRLQYVSIHDVSLFPDYVFCNPFNGDKSYTMHHFSGSWSK